MPNNLPTIILKGVIGGAFSGFVIGAYFVEFSKKYVFRADDFRHVIFQEETEFRYTLAVVSAFVAAFAMIGPYVAAGSYGSWIRHAIYGLVGCVGFVVGLAGFAGFFYELLYRERPFGRSSQSFDMWYGMAHHVGIPLALVIGPWIGIGIGCWRFANKPSSLN